MRISMNDRTTELLLPIAQENAERNSRNNLLLASKLQAADVSGAVEGDFPRPTIIVGAGPSLSKNMRRLRFPERVSRIFAGTRAAASLLQYGIGVDVCAVVDPQSAIADHLQGLTVGELRSVRLWVLTPSVHPSLVSLLTDAGVADRIRLVSLPDGKGGAFGESQFWARYAGAPAARYAIGGCVSTLLVTVAFSSETGPVALVGQDLAYAFDPDVGLVQHAYGAARAAPPEELMTSVLSWSGRDMVRSPLVYSVYARFFEMTALASIKQQLAVGYANPILFNCTEGGRNIAGWRPLTLRAFLETFDNVKEAAL